MEHLGNILDPIHPTLPPEVWDNAGTPDPKLKEQHRKWIQHTVVSTLDSAGYKDAEAWLSLVLTGSLTTYQYSEASDCDVSLFVDAEAFPEWSRAEMIGVMVSKVDGTSLPGTPYTMQCFVVPRQVRKEDLYKPGLRSGYDLKEDEWLVPPDPHRSMDIEKQMNGAYVYALESADKMERLLRYEPDRAIDYWHQLHKARQRAQKEGRGDYSLPNIVYKFLANKGLFPKLEEATGEYIAKHSWRTVEDGIVLPDVGDEANGSTVTEIDNLSVHLEDGRALSADQVVKTAAFFDDENPSEDPESERERLERNRLRALPDVMYHVAPVGRRDSILQGGLTPEAQRINTDSDHAPGVYLWEDPETAWKYRGQGPNMYRDMDLYAVQAPRSELREDPWFTQHHQDRATDFPGAWYSENPIQADRIRPFYVSPWHPLISKTARPLDDKQVAKFVYDVLKNKLVVGEMGRQEGEKPTHHQLLKLHDLDAPNTVFGQVHHNGWVDTFLRPQITAPNRNLNPAEVDYRLKQALEHAIPGVRWTNPPFEPPHDYWDLDQPPDTHFMGERPTVSHDDLDHSTQEDDDAWDFQVA